jgi:isopenicillin-N epimerase
VIADHGYGAVLLTLEYLKKRYKIQVRKAIVPLPLQDTAEITEAFARAITPATKLLIVDHITSASALIFPVEAILELAHSKGIPVLVDGAHAPGMLSLKLKELGADFYTGNLHKWVCAPKGCAFIYVAPAWREQIEPGAISHFYGKSLPERFGWTGTFDPSAWLSIPAALEFWENHGWDREGNYRLVQVGRQELAEVLKQPLPHPDSPSLYGSMAVVPFPWGNGKNLRELTHRLYAEHQIEVPFTSYDGRCWLRISGMRYNHASQYTRLASILGGGWGQ